MNIMTITFATLNINNSEKNKYGFIAYDDSGFNHACFEFNNWQEIKDKYPTRLSFLISHEETLCYSKLDYLVDENDKVSIPAQDFEIYDLYNNKHTPTFKEIIFIGDEKLYS